jgi:purine-binding chemotaxis protein CheW
MTTASQYLILNIGPHHFAVNVGNITDVIKQSRKTPVPLASKNIAGVLNLRGHIVTEIDVATTLDIPHPKKENGFAVVINKEEELYSFVFDQIGDVMEIGFSQIAPLPETVQKDWHHLSKGVYKLADKLVVILDLAAFVEAAIPAEADSLAS